MPNASPAHHTEAPGDGAPRPAPRTDRLANLEAAVVAIQQTLGVQLIRMAQMQAQIDLLVAKNRKGVGAEDAE